MSETLVLAPFADEQLRRLAGEMSVTHESWLETRRLHDPEELAQRLNTEKARYLVVEADFVFAETLEQAERLEVAGICRNALNHVDLEAATRLGVLVVNTPGRNAVAVAELTVAMVLGLARPLSQAQRYISSGQWADPADAYERFRGTELAGKTGGIIGLGAIGRLVARRLLAMDMELLASDPYVSETEMSALGVRKRDLGSLLAEADYVLVHAPASPSTLGMIGPKALASMKPSAYLVNTSAAGVCDEAALIKALEERRIAGAALDVFDGQHLPLSSRLLKLDNVLLTPHIGGATAETVQRHSRMIVDDLLLARAGKRPVHLVNPDAWERWRGHTASARS